ncbi:MAG: hypothetical protein ABL984_14635 [Pyrinomonadaceae bacterium]
MSDSSRKRIARKTMRTVVRLYPRRFRKRFEDQILRTFADLVDDISDHGRSMLLLTVASLYDASVGVVQEWTKELVTTMLKTETTTRIAVVLCVPFALLIAAALFDGTILNAQLLSIVTVDGQQLNGIGRVIVFGSVLLLPISLVVNLAGLIPSFRQHNPAILEGRVSSVSLAAVQTIALLTIAGWIVTETVSCSRGICD